jgi:hypothetical protein
MWEVDVQEKHSTLVGRPCMTANVPHTGWDTVNRPTKHEGICNYIALTGLLMPDQLSLRLLHHVLLCCNSSRCRMRHWLCSRPQSSTHLEVP